MRELQEHTAAGASGLKTVLGEGSVVEGKVSFVGEVRIDGSFTGEITTNDRLIVGPSAKVSANISCGSAVVNGEVTGNIRATESVEMHQPARVKGDVATPSLAIDKGVVFEGLSRMVTGDLNLVSLNRRENGRKPRGRAIDPTDT